MGVVRKTILFHFGYPKTASSLIQQSLLKDLHDSGKVNLMTWRMSDPKEPIEDRFSSSLFLEKRPVNLYFNLKDDRLNVISDESLTAPLRLRWNNFGRDIAAPNTFPNKIINWYGHLKNEGWSLKSLVIFRNQPSLLYSQYVEEYNLVLRNAPYDLLFDDEKQICFKGLESYDFFDCLKSLESSFGPKNVTGLFFEQLLTDSNGFFDALACSFDCSSREVQQTFQDNRINRKKRNDKGYFTVGQTMIPFFTAEQKAKILERYSPGNKELLKHMNIRDDKIYNQYVL